MRLSNATVSQNITSTCKFNGKYDKKLSDFACTECDKPADVPNGKFVCSSPNFAVGSNCILQCNQGFVASKQVLTNCKRNASEDGTVIYNDYWDRDASQFACQRQISVVIGGSDSEKRYLAEAEVFAPTKQCHGNQLGPLPYPTVSPIAGFLGEKVHGCDKSLAWNVDLV